MSDRWGPGCSSVFKHLPSMQEVLEHCKEKEGRGRGGGGGGGRGRRRNEEGGKKGRKKYM